MQNVFIEKLPAQAIPAVAGPQHRGAAVSIALQLHPAEVAQLPALAITAVTGHTGRIQIKGAGAVGAKGAAQAIAALEGVVHVAEHHQRQRPPDTDLTDRQGQVLIAPVAGVLLPVTAAGIGRLAAQARGAAVGQQHERQIGSARRAAWVMRSADSCRLTGPKAASIAFDR
jgi:hypothetical protein